MDKTQINIFLILSFLIIITLLVGLFYFIFQFRKRKIQEELEKQITINQERERIIKDLHDDLGGSLNSIQLISDLIINHRLEQQELIESIVKISKTSKNISQQIKTVVWSLDAEKDTLLNLIEYIKYYSKDFFQPTSISLEFNNNTFEDKFISGFLRKNIFLAFKEVLNNIIKHSNATKVSIDVKTQNNSIAITIQDNGVGIEAVNPFGNGLKNIKNRIKEINGEVLFLNNNGTQICITVPLL